LLLSDLFSVVSKDTAKPLALLHDARNPRFGFAEKSAARRFVRQLNLRGEVPTGRQLPARWQ